MCTSLMVSGARSSLQGMRGDFNGVAGLPGGKGVRLWVGKHRALLIPEPLLCPLAPSSALYASRLYLSQYQLTHPERLAKHSTGGPRIRGTHPAPVLNLCPHPSPSAL